MRLPRPAYAARRGAALLALVAAVVLLSVMGATLVDSTVWASRRNDTRIERADARTAAESAATLAAEVLWDGFRNDLGGALQSPQAFRTYTSSLGLTNQSGANPPVRADWSENIGLARDAQGELMLGDARLLELLVHREDVGRAVRIHITATAAIRRGDSVRDDVAASVTRVWAVEPPLWDGLDFALLANNVNCIMCHTEVDSAQRVFNAAPSNYGTFDRVRVGSIESFQFREDPDSNIAGTLYIGGSAVDARGRLITNWAGLPLESAAMDAHGHLMQDAFGDLRSEHLRPADAGNPERFENLYLDYFNLGQIDGMLPETFPPPFPDDGGYDLLTGSDLTAGTGNRAVDDAEFEATVAGFAGSLSGGSIGVVPPGQTVTSAGQLSTLLEGNTASLDAVTRGQVILVGTEDNPIRLDGNVAVDGDVILSGYVVGMGSLWARGNVYIRGDLRYLDGEVNGQRTFGIAPNGAPNGMALTAGGNIVIGDLYRPSFGQGAAVTGRANESWSFTLEEMGIFNRREWIKTQPELPGRSERIQIGTETRTQEIVQWRPTGEFVDVPIYETRIVTPRTDYHPEVTERVLVRWERRERRERIVTGTREVSEPIYRWVRPMLPNPDYAGPDYFPRYYAFDSTTTVPIYNKRGWFDPSTGLWICDERAGGWSTQDLTFADPTNPNDPILYSSPGVPRALVSSLTPTADWLSNELLRQLIQDTLSQREANEAFEIDATLYSANSLFGVVPIGDGTDGRLSVNGAVIGADVGLLGPRGTRILYDGRGKDLLDIRDPARVGIFRMLAAPAPL